MFNDSMLNMYQFIKFARISYLLVIFVLLNSSSIFASKWLTGEYQRDSRDFNTLNFTGFSKLPYGFSTWGFVDFEGAKGVQTHQSDLSTYFLEIDLRSPSWHGLGGIVELDATTGMGNDTGRAGIYYQPKATWLKKNHAFLFFKGFPLESNGDVRQISFGWNLKFPDFIDGRFSMGGFADWNLNSGPNKDTNLVTDTQFRFRLIEKLSLLVEYRKNEFIANNESGTGVGLQYKF
jgi:hypothetical protein